MIKRIALFLRPSQIERLKIEPLPFKLGDNVECGTVDQILREVSPGCYECKVWIRPDFEVFANRELAKINSKNFIHMKEINV